MATEEAVEPIEHQGLPTMVVPVTRLRPNPWNPNKQSEQVAKAERESIKRFGFIDPISAMADWDDADSFVIVDGEHRWRAAQDLGYISVPIVVLDITVDEAKKLTIVLNETRGDADVVLLGQLLAEIRDSAPSVEEFQTALPYSSSELDHLLDIGSLDWDQFGNEGGGGGRNGGVNKDHEFVLAFKDAGTLARFKDWVDITRREQDGIDAEASDSDVVADTMRRTALALSQGD